MNTSTALPSTVAHMAALLHPEVDAVGQIVWKHGSHCPWVSYGASDIDRVAAEVAARPEDCYLRTTLIDPTYTGATRGGGTITVAVTALFVDIDVAGPTHKPGSTLPLPNRGQVDQLLAQLPPASLLVSTGGGVHGWWLLADPILTPTEEDQAGAKRITTAWQAGIIERARKMGFHVDKTDDLARIGRLCGTVNNKPGANRARVHLAAAATWPELDSTPPRRWALSDLADIFYTPPVPSMQPARPTRRSNPNEATPANATDSLSWSQILEPHGWRLVGHENLSGRSWERWLRPGDPTSDYSLKADPDGPCVVWSSAAGLPAGPGQRLTKFRVVAHLEFGGDEVAAARFIRRQANERRRVAS